MIFQTREKRLPTIDEIDAFLDNIYFNVGATVPGGPFSVAGQEMIIKSITQFIVGMCAAWWSIHELIDMIRNRQAYKESLYGNTTASP